MATEVLSIFSPDQNLNRVEGGSTVTSRFSPAVRGSTGLENINIGLDGYGFTLERRLVNAAGTGPCSPAELVCRWKVLMGTWSQGYIGDLRLTGATAPALPTAEAAIVDTTVRGVTVGTSALGTVQ